MREGWRAAEYEWNMLKDDQRVDDCDKVGWPLLTNGATTKSIVDGDGWVIMDIG